MKCQVCQHHPAAFHVTEINEVDPSLTDPHQQIEQRHLCPECARQLNLPHMPVSKPAQLDIWKLLQQSARAQAHATHLACPDCGMTLAEFRAKGRLGCPRDYEIFQEHLDPLIERIHNAKLHSGRGPGSEEGDRPQQQPGTEAAAPEAASFDAPDLGASSLEPSDPGLPDSNLAGGKLGSDDLDLQGLPDALSAENDPEPTGESELETLESALQQAIEAEEYERAADLRDAIQALRDSEA